VLEGAIALLVIRARRHQRQRRCARNVKRSVVVIGRNTPTGETPYHHSEHAISLLFSLRAAHPAGGKTA
jgi:hypothetical protein